MSIKEGLKSDDPEVVRLYVELALSETSWSPNTITGIMKDRFYIHYSKGNYYLIDRDKIVGMSYIGMRYKGVKLNFTFKKI